MYRAQSTGNRRKETELSLQYKEHFFISAGGRQYRCIICPTRPMFSSFYEALQHESTIEHIGSRRDFDRPAPRPVTIARQSAAPPAFRPSLGVFQPSDYLYTPSSSTSLGDAPLSDMHAAPRPSGGDSRSNIAGDSWHSDLQAYSRSPEAYFAIPGPALPSDPPDTVYGLCGGAADHDNDPLSDEEEPLNIGGIYPSEHTHTGGQAHTAMHPAAQSPPSVPSHSIKRPRLIGVPKGAPLPKIKVPDFDSQVWWPFKSREASEALFCLMTAFPRAIFSNKELDVVRWFTEKCGVPNMPANSTVESRFKDIMKLLGLESQLKQSKLENYFAVSSIGTIIANELANPLVREQMVFYAQDEGAAVRQAANGKHWMEEVDASLAAPMVRKDLPVGHQDYFVHEPFLASLEIDGQLVPRPLLPIRYFERSGSLFARSHPLLSSDAGYTIDGDTHIDVPVSSFLLPFPEFCQEYERYELPCPKNIIGIRSSTGHRPWSEPTENPWRSRANGRIVRSVPFWLYCDDTSGNQSKKWNKHNSFLFTLAGLPREYSQNPYNVHFLSTSNIATPLEMLEAITAELIEIQSTGVVAFDCKIGEDILAIPWVYAMQGDNPMQSELCSHIGLGGKFFCRVCQVRGSDKDRGETQESEIGRIADFMKIHELRHVSDTVAHLRSQEETALRGALSSIDDEARKTGVKDKYLIAFMALLKEQRDAHRPALSRAAGVEFVQKLRQTFPKDLYNPALFLPELDPNQDTPVEILHVILLGIAKYFWRDAVARQGQDGRETMKARINGLDLEGLGLRAPHGATLVQYAKSLTGGDFRVILQISPIVLYDLVPARVYAAWLALSRLAPLAFQSEIDDIDAYIPRLSESIDALLQATVAWSPQWFNKPKFHILLHLPEHIRRFGPAVLFATETFESYNFVIRLRSIHSNRRAPSHDIGWAFCRLQAIRFLVSGGWVTRQVDPVTEKIVPSAPRQAGSSVLELQHDPLFMQLMGMSFLFAKRSHGSFKLVPAAGTVAWGDTIASQSESLAGTFEGLTLAACETVDLANHDTVHVKGFVLIQTAPEAQPCPAKVLEIWATANSGSLVGLTVQIGSIVSHSNIYGMPGVRFDRGNLFIRLEMVICAISLFHNCAEYSCSISRTKIVMQERQETLLRAQEVQHSGDLFDLIINVASLRSATAIQTLRERPRLVESVDAIARAAVVEWDKEKDEAKAEQERKEKEKEEKKAEQQRKKEERERKKAAKEAQAQEDALRGVKPKPKPRKRKRKDGDSGKDKDVPPVS